MHLFEAAQFGRVDHLKSQVEELLISRDPESYDYKELFVDDQSGTTPLHLAASIGHVEVIRYILNQRLIPVNAQDGTGKTPLHDACISGSVKSVNVLIHEFGCDFHLLDEEGRNAFFFACWRNQLEVAQLLLKLGCKVDSKDSSGRTALDEAKDWGHDRIVKFLLELPEFTSKKSMIVLF